MTEQTVLDAILARAAQTPDAVALLSGGRHISYRSMAARVERWASALRRSGVGPESTVAVLLPRAEALVIAILAILRAGAAYVPLDRAHPAARWRAIVSASGASALIAGDNDLRDVVRVMSPSMLDAGGPGAALPMPAGEQLAYVIYTSGSTGAPKGVAIEHRALLNHMRWMIDAFGPHAGERVIQRTSCAFDASVWELFLSVMTGGTLVLAEGDRDREPQALRDLLRRETPAALQVVPTFLRFALERRMFEGTSLRYLFVGGEALTRDVVRNLREQSAAVVVNLYGPTETTIDATFHRIDGDQGCDGESYPIGRPIANVWARPVSFDYRAVGDDAASELWIGGAGLARGYHRAPRLTASAFVPNAFDDRDDRSGSRAYRTGDVARAHDGLLTFLGRSDRLVKLGGFRVELGEIESALRQHPRIGDAVVTLHDTSDTRAVVAYCQRVGDAGDEPESHAIRAFLVERLPHYMLPAQIVWVNRFPMKENGKLDVRALPPPPRGQGAHEPPSGAVEQVLSEIWEQLFRRPIGVSDDFFEAGGDSIRALRVITQAKARGLTLKLQDIFECPTIRRLAARAAWIDGHREDGARVATTAFELVAAHDRERLDTAAIEDAYPTTMLLDALYFLNETSAQYEVYVTSCDLRAAWNPDAFHAALSRVVTRHPWLRTSFAYEGFSRPLQFVHTQVPLAWHAEDLRGRSPHEQEVYLAAWFDREKRLTFDWLRPPVWRVTVHERAADRFQLTVSEPIFDGWSVSSFFGELLEDYAAACQGRLSPPRPTPRSLYRDFVVAEQRALADPACIEFWQRSASGAVGRGVPRLAHEHGRARGVHRHELRLSRNSSERLREVARLASAPLKSVLLAAHARVLAALTGRATVVSGVIMNGRAEGLEAEQVLGLHINTVPLTIALKDAASWTDLIRHAFEVEKQALPYRRFPLAAIQKMHGRTPLFDAAFNFTHFHGLGDALRRAGVAVRGYLAWDQTFFPLTAQFHVDVNDATIGLGLDYDASELSAAQVTDIARLYRDALERIAADPARSCKAPVWTPTVITGVALPSERGHDVNVLTRIRRTAASQPDAVAVSQGPRGDVQLSYGALTRAVTRLADDLHEHGVSGQSVLVCFETQYEAVVSVLAVIEAGGIPVPITPAFPAPRIERISRSASASICLCAWESADVFVPLGVTPMMVDLEALCLRPSSARTRPGRLPGSAAYRIFTSGSTGTPKGVEVGHASLVHLLDAMLALTRVSRADVVTGLTTIAFDISLLEMLLPLLAGGRLVTLDRDCCRDGEALHDALRLSEATLCQATPTTWRLLMETRPTLPRGLHVLSGGEALSPDLASRLLAAGATLTNVYGPTETTIWSSAGRIETTSTITLGAPLAGQALRVADAFLDPCMPGVVGEIHIGGVGLAHGYVGNPRLTAAKFIPDLAGDGQRCYRTGDDGRATSAGAIVFLGRTDDQVKVRGYRIELGEIEHALQMCPGIREAVVTVVGAEPAVLAAYVTLHDEIAWDEVETKRHLRRSLPDHLIPRHFVVMDALPRTANHKTDRSRLPATFMAPARGRRVLELFEQVKTMHADDVKRALAARA